MGGSGREGVGQAAEMESMLALAENVYVNLPRPIENLSITTIRSSPVRYHAPRATQIKTIDSRVDKMPRCRNVLAPFVSGWKALPFSGQGAAWLDVPVPALEGLQVQLLRDLAYRHAPLHVLKPISYNLFHCNLHTHAFYIFVSYE